VVECGSKKDTSSREYVEKSEAGNEVGIIGTDPLWTRQGNQRTQHRARQTEVSRKVKLPHHPPSSQESQSESNDEEQKEKVVNGQLTDDKPKTEEC